MDTRNDYTVVLTTSTMRKKIAKLMLLSDGSFALGEPYQSAQQGYFVRHPVDYSARSFSVPLDKVFEEYNASNPAKLSMHASGFVQFSGPLIRSGLDTSSKAAKGLGYWTSPLTSPINTGPTAGLVVWGLEEFNDFTKLSRGSTLLEFEDKDLYYEASPEMCNGYHVDVFVFSKQMWWGIYPGPKGLTVEASFNHNDIYATWTMRVIPLQSIGSFLGVCMAAAPAKWATPSGYFLHGPGVRKSTTNHDEYAMFACYPNVFSRAAPSLDKQL
ncbi:MAG: hypothetical protein M1294_08725 [Firmicutes bacterium]|nr:hypothetical protein [Bacillota bacterium]